MKNSRIICINEEFHCKVLKTSHKRVGIAFFITLGLSLTLVLRILDISIFSLNEPHDVANLNSQNIQKTRKNILDRNGIILASTLPTASAYIYPKHFISPNKSLGVISKMLDIDIIKMKERVVNNKHFVWLKRHLTPGEQQKLHNLGIPGVYLIPDQKRIYPHKNLFSHVVGLVDIDNNGISGLEASFNNSLQDSTTKDLQITLDARIQYIIRKELKDSIEMNGAIGGTSIVMDIHTGEVISLVSLPDFNPYNNHDATNRHLFNQATLGVYEMGSVLKAFTIAMGIDSGEISIHDSFDVSIPLKIDNYTIRDYRGKGGILSVPEILMYSSNLGVAQIIQEVGISKQKDYFRKLGIFSKLSIEIPEISNSLYPKDYRWRKIQSITMSYGHGIAMTPIHLIQAFSAIVNNGFFRKATLIKGTPVQEKQVFKRQTSFLMNKILRLSAESGFAKRANLDEYLIGAKTGTAEKIINGKYNKKLNVALCTAAFPMNDPKYTILVLIDEPQPNKINLGLPTGGMVAAPVISKIVQKIAPILDIVPVDYKDPELIKALYINYKPMYKRYAKK